MGWLLGLFLVSLVLALAALVVSLSRRPPSEPRQEPRFDSNVALRGELESLRGELGQLRARADKMDEKLESLNTPQPATPYSQAVQMAISGANAEQIASRCGISRGEAELIVALNRVQPR
jgi:hypothetical protein